MSTFDRLTDHLSRTWDNLTLGWQQLREREDGRFHVFECAYGSFERAIPLPADVDDSAAKARYRRGVLDITLPKISRSQRQRIEVKG